MRPLRELMPMSSQTRLYQTPTRPSVQRAPTPDFPLDPQLQFAGLEGIHLGFSLEPQPQHVGPEADPPNASAIADNPATSNPNEVINGSDNDGESPNGKRVRASASNPIHGFVDCLRGRQPYSDFNPCHDTLYHLKLI